MMIKAIAFFYGLFLAVSCFSQGNHLQPPVVALPSAKPAAVNMRQDSISKLIALINTTPHKDFRAIVVIRDHKLVVEEYFNTYWRETIHDVRSAGKGITALLLGIAIDKGFVKNTNQSVGEFFPKVKGLLQAQIKIKDLLSMSSGLGADDDDANSPGRTSNWLLKTDWVDYALSLPMIFKPGEKYVYNDVCPMLIGAIIEKTSGKKLADFAKENLFDPLGIREYYWYTAPNGSTGPMGNLYLSAIDFAKIGDMVLSKGKWQGKQIVSASWIEQISIERFDLSGQDPFARAYGCFWFKGEKVVNNKVYKYMYASGNGGNLLIVVPSEQLVVSLLSSAYGQGYAHHRSFKILDFVLNTLDTK